jgi:hypothetical protein
MTSIQPQRATPWAACTAAVCVVLGLIYGLQTHHAVFALLSVPVGVMVFVIVRTVLHAVPPHRWPAVIGTLWALGAALQGIVTDDVDAVVSAPTVGVLAYGVATELGPSGRLRAMASRRRRQRSSQASR